MKHSEVSSALASIRSGQRVFVHGGSATPNFLLKGLVAEAGRFADVELIHLHTEGPASYADPKYAKSFRVANLFVGSNIRNFLDYDRIDYLPCFLSEIPQLFRSGKRPLDAALLHLSAPNEEGFCSLGVSVDIALSAAQTAKCLIAQINPQMPFVYGDGLIHIDEIHHWIEVNEPLPVSKRSVATPEEKKIGYLVSSLVEDGATLQFGIGAIPDAVAACLTGHKDLGIHSEMWSDGALDLIESGVVNNSKKILYPGKTVSGFIMGTQRVFNFIHDNPAVIQLDSAFVNSIHSIRQNPKVVAVNSAVEVDLTGQVCADSIGPRIISGVGGQMDFIRGASLSNGGKPIIALTSRGKKGQSKIVAALRNGAGIVTTRAHVHYVVTEYGIADLYGKTLGERAKILIGIAHPDDRESLQREWKSRLHN